MAELLAMLDLEERPGESKPKDKASTQRGKASKR
jgi:hypothetical protein